MVGVREDIAESFREFRYRESDVLFIRAIRFKGAKSNSDFLEIISNEIALGSAEIELLYVKLEDNRPEGTHAYIVGLKNMDSVHYPIWQKF